MFRDIPKIINLLASVFYDPPTYYTKTSAILKVIVMLKIPRSWYPSNQWYRDGSTQYLITSQTSKELTFFAISYKDAHLLRNSIIYSTLRY